MQYDQEDVWITQFKAKRTKRKKDRKIISWRGRKMYLKSERKIEGDETLPQNKEEKKFRDLEMEGK